MSGNDHKSEVQFGETLTRGGHFARSAFTSGPGLLWLTLFLLGPLLAIVLSVSRRAAPMARSNRRRLWKITDV
jgi:hypothetical protein